MRRTVLMTISAVRVSEGSSPQYSPFGRECKGTVEYATAIAGVVDMLASCANVDVTVKMLKSNRIELFYEYNRARDFGLSNQQAVGGSSEPYYGWLYTIEPDPDSQHEAFQQLASTVYAWCVTVPQIRSEEVAQYIEGRLGAQ